MTRGHHLAMREQAFETAAHEARGHSRAQHLHIALQKTIGDDQGANRRPCVAVASGDHVING